MTENKHYYDFTNELSTSQIYEGLLAHGLFTEKLPPVFTAKEFSTTANHNHLLFLKIQRSIFIMKA